MASQRSRNDEARIRLSRERVLEAAVDLADRDGLASLSMRRLAQALGVEAMSLYHHVANKDEILDGMVEAVLSRGSVPAGDDWKATIRRIAISTHESLVAHPWAASLMLSRATPSRLRYMEGILGSLRRGGFSPEMTDHAYHAIDSHVSGFTLWEASFNLEPETLPSLADAFLRNLPADYPYIAEHVHEHLKERPRSEGGEFAFGLDLILDGLERLRSGSIG